MRVWTAVSACLKLRKTQKVALAHAHSEGRGRTVWYPRGLSLAFWNLGTVLSLFHARAHLIFTTTERGRVTTEAEREGRSCKPRNPRTAGGHQQPGEAQTDSP